VDIHHIKKIVSAGGVVLRPGKDSIEVALIRTVGSVGYQLPKGMLDDGETREMAALREVREETGVHAELIEHIGRIAYSYSADYGKGEEHFEKTVDFFLMSYVSGSILDHDNEVAEVMWVNIAEAERVMRYESEIGIIKAIPTESLSRLLA